MVMVHELGHHFFQDHSGAGTDEYGDTTCAMGSCCHDRCYNTPRAWHMGWTTVRGGYLTGAAAVGWRAANLHARHGGSMGRRHGFHHRCLFSHCHHYRLCCCAIPAAAPLGPLMVFLPRAPRVPRVPYWQSPSRVLCPAPLPAAAPSQQHAPACPRLGPEPQHELSVAGECMSKDQ